MILTNTTVNQKFSSKKYQRRNLDVIVQIKICLEVFKIFVDLTTLFHSFPSKLSQALFLESRKYQTSILSKFKTLPVKVAHSSGASGRVLWELAMCRRSYRTLDKCARCLWGLARKDRCVFQRQPKIDWWPMLVCANVDEMPGLQDRKTPKFVER